MRILQVTPSIAPRDGGPSVAVREIARALQARGHQVLTISTDADGPDRLDLASCRNEVAHDLDVRVARVHSPRRYHMSWGLWRELRSAAPSCDIVHLHYYYSFPTVAGACTAGRLGKPYFVHMHGVLEPAIRPNSRRVKRAHDLLLGARVLRGSAGLVFASEREANRAADFTVGCTSFIAPLGATVGPGCFPDAGIDGQFVLYLGRLVPTKRLDLLIEAWTHVTRYSSETLLIAGTGEPAYVARLRQLVRDNGLTTTVRFLGHVSGPRKDWLLRKARMTVLPSEYESFALSVAEALVAGTPAVVSEHVALASEIARYNAGAVIDLRATSLSDALLRLLSDDKSYAAARSGAAELGKRYTWSNTAAVLEEAYTRALVN